MVLHVANAMAAYACARCDYRFAVDVASAAPAAGLDAEYETGTVDGRD
jgi:hypothetical protein